MPSVGPITNNTQATDELAASLVTTDEPDTQYVDQPNGSVES